MLVVTYLILTFDNILLASELVHDFKNPSFSGNGYSQHVLSLNQLEVQRKEGVEDDINTTTINEYVANIGSDGVILPSVEPAVFELKFPNKDIRGKVL